ncbi:hypothetical protein [Wolbachia endosymbiont of Cantharis cryptica]|uniref:hypothetical protein n=1 Tax=Wolbachia endosymbiont of Cantharis cryptica TaxID=3066132 RepID=UPI00376F3942
MTNSLISIILEIQKDKNNITKLQDFLDRNKKGEIVIDKEIFKSVLPREFDGVRNRIVYLILHHCIEHDSARSEKGERLLFQDVMNILDKAMHRFTTSEYFHGLINFRDKNGNTLLHQAVINSNTGAIITLLECGANPLIKNGNKQTPLDLAQTENTREALVNGMTSQAKSKKESAKYNSLSGIIPSVFLGIGLGVGSALVPSMTIILCALAVSALISGIAVGLAIYFLSQDYKQAKSIEKAVDSQLSSVEHKKTHVIAGNKEHLKFD